MPDTMAAGEERTSLIYVANKDREVHEYTVVEMRVVNPYDEWVTEERGEEMLTLFTCSNHGTRRFVCKCVRNEDFLRHEKTVPKEN